LYTNIKLSVNIRKDIIASLL